MTTNLATVAILPVSENVPIENFTLELQHALGAIGKFNSTVGRFGVMSQMMRLFLTLPSISSVEYQ